MKTTLTEKQYNAYIDQKVGQLSAMYRDTEHRLQKIVSSVSATDFQKARADALLKQVKAEVAFLNNGATEWAKESTRAAYGRGVTVTGKMLDDAGVGKVMNMGSQIHPAAMNVIADQTAMELLEANGTITKKMTRYLRLTQQQALSEKAIDKAVAQGVLEGRSRRRVSNSVYRGLRKELGDGKFLRINGRNYSPRKYAELVARTRTREATTAGAKNACLEYGQDLVKVSTHAHPQIDPCSEHQGKVYSISGNDPDFPQLTDEPPFHPNCGHVIVPYVKESYTDEEVRAYKEISNNPDQVIPGPDVGLQSLSKEDADALMSEYRDHFKKSRGHYPKTKAEKAEFMEELQKATAHNSKPVGGLAPDTAVAATAGAKEVPAYSGQAGWDDAQHYLEDLVLDKHEKEALKKYTGSGYKVLNEFLRASTITDDMKPIVSNLEKALNALPRWKGTVYRGLSFRNDPFLDDFMRSIKPGNVFSDKAFMSTSVLREQMESFIPTSGFHVVELQATSKSGRIVGLLSRHPKEHEVLFNRGSSFRVLSVEEAPQLRAGGFKHIIIKVEEV